MSVTTDSTLNYPINIQPLTVIDWGLMDYELALQKQMELVETVSKNNLPGYIVFCTHPPVVTLGRKTEPNDVFAWKGPTVEVSRGGRATYHGPSQLVIYPIVNLNYVYNPTATSTCSDEQIQRAYHDINKYLRNLEKAILRTLKTFAISAETKSYPDTGIWVQDKKIASLGVAVKNWVTYHGAAINILNDPNAFQGMNPCGLSNDVMTNLENLLPNHSTSDFLYNHFKTAFLNHIHWIG